MRACVWDFSLFRAEWEMERCNIRGAGGGRVFDLFKKITITS